MIRRLQRAAAGLRRFLWLHPQRWRRRRLPVRDHHPGRMIWLAFASATARAFTPGETDLRRALQMLMEAVPQVRRPGAGRRLVPTDSLVGTRGAEADSAYAWARLFAALLLATLGGVGMWSIIVALPAVQAEFGVARADASLPYTMTMIGFGLGGILMGRVSDRFGIIVSVAVGAFALALGYLVASSAGSLWQLALAQGLLIGVGSSASFGPLIATASMWHAAAGYRRRYIAERKLRRGSNLAADRTHFIGTVGWRYTYFGIGVFCAPACCRSGGAETAIANRAAAVRTHRAGHGPRTV